MRAVVQRVRAAQVSVEGSVVGQIDAGLLVFIGVQEGDTEAAGDWLAKKIAGLRVFDDVEGRMNLSLLDIPEASALVISQFTLFGTTRKGYRPSFNRAAEPEQAKALYLRFAQTLEALLERPVPTGRFGEYMRIDAQNDGPVTLWFDTNNKDL
ncbi:MAG: D-aminoacyl-tRNA deacylase [Opitutales bacterium]